MRLLVTDDELRIREMLTQHFALKGFEVESAENGREALDKMARQRYDILISDIMMPEMNGVDLLRQVRTEYPMVRVIMMTGAVTLENVLACMRRGADTCVFKPLSDLTELDEAVQHAVGHLEAWQKKMRQLRHIEKESQGDKS